MNVTPVLISSAEPSTTLVNTPGRVHAVPVAPDLRREMRLCIDNVSTVGAAFRPSSRRRLRVRRGSLLPYRTRLG